MAPTGISGAYVLNPKNTIDAAFSWDLNNDDQNFYLHSTYLWHQRDFLKLDKVRLSTYFGGGGRLISWEDPPGKDKDTQFRAGARGVLGLNYYFKKPKIEVFGEVSLTLDLIPNTASDLDLGIGARFYF